MRCQQRPRADKRGVKVEARHPHCQGNEAGMTAVLDALPTGATRGTDSTTESSNQDAAVTNDSSPDNQDPQQELSLLY